MKAPKNTKTTENPPKGSSPFVNFVTSGDVVISGDQSQSATLWRPLWR